MGNKISRRRANVDERYTRTQGLYEHKDVDQKKLRRLILDAKLAPCYPGIEDQITDLEECPICFLFYPSLNRSKCCCKCICTECFLQMKAAHSGRSTPCPFCKVLNFAVEYRGAKTTEEKGLEQAEEQKVIEAKIRIRQRELKDEQEQMQRRDESRQHGRFTIRPSLLRENFSSSLGCDSSATAGMAPSAVGRLHDRRSPPENSGSIIGGQHPLITEEEQHAMLLSRRLSGRGWTLPQPAGGSTSVCTQRENESGSSFIQPDRDNEFDLDLEDIMVMEAIWLSIQEQNPQWQTSLSASGGYMTTSGFIDCAVDMQLSIHESQEDIPAVSEMEERDIPVRSSVTGGLASALAVLAETQIRIVDSAGPVQVQDFSTCNDNSVPSIRNGAKNTARSVSVLGDLSGGEDIAEVSELSSGYVSSTRFNTHLDKECIYKGNESGSVVENDAESERRESLNWQDLDANERFESWIEISLDSGRVLSTT